MTQRDAVDVAADALTIAKRIVNEHIRGARPSITHSDMVDAIAEAFRSASNSGAEAMREAAARLLDGEIVCERYVKWPFFDSDADYRDTSDKAWFAQKAAAAIRALPAPGAPASPWLGMESAPKDGRPFLILTSYAPNPVHEASWEKEADAFLFANGTICANAIGWMPMPLPTPPASKDT